MGSAADHYKAGELFESVNEFKYAHLYFLLAASMAHGDAYFKLAMIYLFGYPTIAAPQHNLVGDLLRWAAGQGNEAAKTLLKMAEKGPEWIIFAAKYLSPNHAKFVLNPQPQKQHGSFAADDSKSEFVKPNANTANSQSVNLSNSPDASFLPIIQKLGTLNLDGNNGHKNSGGQPMTVAGNINSSNTSTTSILTMIQTFSTDYKNSDHQPVIVAGNNNSNNSNNAGNGYAPMELDNTVNNSSDSSNADVSMSTLSSHFNVNHRF